MGPSGDQMVKHVKVPNSIVCGLDLLNVPMKSRRITRMFILVVFGNDNFNFCASYC